MIINSQITKKTSGGGGRLPQGYTEVPYIKSTGLTGQKIEIPFVFSANDSINFDFTLISGASYHRIITLGENKFIDTDNPITRLLFFEGSGYFRYFDVANGVKMRFATGNFAYKVFNSDNPVFNFSEGSARNITQTTNISLGSAGVSNECCYHHYAHYNSQGILIAELVPCKRDSDNKAGFYEMVGNNYYTSDVAFELPT